MCKKKRRNPCDFFFFVTLISVIYEKKQQCLCTVSYTHLDVYKRQTMCGRKKLAYVGNTPGKTRLLNFFNLDDKYMFVDVPGYGYANISKTQLMKFGQKMCIRDSY